MDEHFQLSAGLATLEAGHDNKSAPDGAPTPNPGASPTEIGHDRLMHNVQPTTDTPPAICPACGQDGQGHRLTTVPAAVPRAEYLCGNGHLWITSWFAGGAA